MRRVFVGLMVVVLLLGVAAVSVVSAQSPTPACPNFLDENGDGVCDVGGGSGTQGRQGMMGRGMMGGRWGGDTFIATVAEELDLTVEQVLAELDDDTTLRQVIVNHSGDPEAIVAAYLALRSETLQQWVADGKLTQAQADLMLDRMETQLTARLDQVGAQGCGAMMRRGGACGRAMGAQRGMFGGRGRNNSTKVPVGRSL